MHTTQRTEDTSVRSLIATSCRILGNLDLSHEALGHVSHRAPGSETLSIKAKGPAEVGLRYCTPGDVIEVGLDVHAVRPAAGLRPPSETFIHTGIYRENPDVRSVVHVHPEHAVLLTICRIPVRPIYGAYGIGSRLAVDPVPVYPRSMTVADDEAGRDFARFMGTSPVAMMRGHGITVTGSSVEEATIRTIAFCRLATMTYRAHLLGTPLVLPDDEIDELRRPISEHRPRGSAGGSAGVLATWRYYERLAGGVEPAGTSG